MIHQGSNNDGQVLPLVVDSSDSGGGHGGTDHSKEQRESKQLRYLNNDPSIDHQHQQAPASFSKKQKQKQQQQQQQSKRRMIMTTLFLIVVGSLATVIIFTMATPAFLLDISQVKELLFQENLDSNNNELKTSSISSSSFDPRPYCPDVTRFFPPKELETAVQANRQFHTLGGNLKAVQLLMDNNIDTIVKSFGTHFVPKDDPSTSKTQEFTSYLHDYFQKNYDPRGGYGRPLPGTFDPPHPLIRDNRYVEVADPINTKERWDASIGPVGLMTCPRLIQLGKTGRDGTKWYCDTATNAPADAPAETESNPQTTQFHQNDDDDCHVVSIGGNDNWDFETSVVHQMKGCQTHTFDCTLPGNQPKKKPNRPDIHFYPYCIDDHSYTDAHGRQYLHYFDILEKAGLQQSPPKLFKIDVEGFEYDIFSHMIQQANADPLKAQWLPQQIQVELHWATRMRGVAWMARTRTSAELAIFSNMMFTGGGYLPIFQNWDKGCPSCIEILYFRTLC